jgi:hypothetical protein
MITSPGSGSEGIMAVSSYEAAILARETASVALAFSLLTKSTISIII